MKRVNVTRISLLLALVSMAWLAVGMTSAAPLESQAAVAITGLKGMMSRPLADRCLSDDDTAKYIAWADSEYRDRPLVAMLALTWSDDPTTLAILKTKAAGPETDVSGAAACGVIVRSNRAKSADDMFSALTGRLAKSTSRYERMFVANRLFVDFPARALRPIMDAVRIEPDRGVQCEMLYYVAALADAAAAREVLTWAGNLAFAQVPEGLSLVMGCLTPGRQPGGYNNSTFGLVRALRAKAGATN